MTNSRLVISYQETVRKVLLYLSMERLKMFCQKHNLTILAISRMKTGICIAGVDENRKWIRPQGIPREEIICEDKMLFETFDVVEFFVDEWRGKRPRLEDRRFIRKGKLLTKISIEERLDLLEEIVDPSIESVFHRNRSLGIIKPEILEVNFKRNKFGKKDYEARFKFKDKICEKVFDWPCTDIRWKNCWIEFIKYPNKRLTPVLNKMANELNKIKTYFVIGLTWPFTENPGPFQGMWPMIVGVHTFPEYYSIIKLL